MKKKLLSLGLVLCMVLPLFAGVVYADKEETIVILYENDVHCAIDGYTKLSAMRNELKETYRHVGIVSSGDFVQGGTIGAISRGEYIVDIMNLIGYDAVTLGNHEFDYHLERLDELYNMMDTKPVSCNFYKVGEEKSVYEPYSIVSYGDVDIAYIGITTAGTFASTNPAQFKNEEGEFIYTFCDDNLYEVVQKNIDEVEEKGADIVIALSHVGYEDVGDFKDVCDIIKNTDGIDVMLDGHTHSVIEQMNIKNRLGEDVLLTSTGTQFEHIGKLTISEGEIKSELIRTDSYDKTDKAVDECVSRIKNDYAQFGDRVIGESEVDLFTHDGDTRIIRKSETNLGNLCADAFYSTTGADVAFVNGGGLRTPIDSGVVTFDDIYKVFPFNNQLVVVEISGEAIRDMLEMALINYPEEDGSFPHIAGIKFSVDTSIPSSVITDKNSVFVGVDGEYRVYDIKIVNKKTNLYEPLEKDKTYTFVGADYFVLSQGGGMSMFKNAKIINKTGVLDVEALEYYIKNNLGGVIGAEYRDVDERITYTNGKIKAVTAAFEDISEDDENLEGIEFVLDNGIMNGTRQNKFAPDESLTRAMAVVILYRMENEPTAEKDLPFCDADMTSYYADALCWAYQNGIVAGISETEFAPYKSVSFEQIAAIMHRYAIFKGYDVGAGDNTNILSYDDFADISDYAIEAMQYASGSGIIKGKTQTTLNPKDKITRGEFASVVSEFIKTNR